MNERAAKLCKLAQFSVNIRTNTLPYRPAIKNKFVKLFASYRMVQTFVKL